MQIIRSLINLKNQTPSVVGIGNFDGVHLAHQQIIKQLKTKAKALNLPLVIISFYPNPSNFFGKNIPSVSSFRQKYNILKSLGVDKFLLIHFNTDFSQIDASDFIQNILIAKLQTKYLLIGDDFVFGKNRGGDINLLKQYLTVKNIKPVFDDGIRISSSNIRKYLKSGDIISANKMLGYDFKIEGRVITGKKLGRTIGFPTANIALKNRTLPFTGVFKVKIVIKNISYPAIANIGYKPTIDSIKKPSLEVFIFDFNADIYGELVEVVFQAKIRDEMKFESLEQLQKQIKKDILIAKNTV